ncbi:MAG TPA: polyprenol monophosphomannose synthase [Lacipirellulaceae bacterium]|nr:polyprenol monophosphomannose synthase [Lacipirellulaceae bacterium]
MTNHSAASSAMNSSHVLVALATYNEIGNLPGLVDAIETVLPEAEVLVVDDNSPDGTGRWCDERLATDSRFHCIHRPGKQGLGAATLAAMQFALNKSYDVVVTMDADWSHDPQFLPALMTATEHADVALGSRYCAGGTIDSWPLPRRVGSRLMNRLSRALLRLPVRDSSGAFRAYRVTALRRIDLMNIRSKGYAYLEEILWHLYRTGAMLVEVPITFHKRRAGRSKINLHEALDKVATLVRLAYSKQDRPTD